MALVLLLAAGCAVNTFKAKSGSGDPEASRALVKPEKNVAISDIDGKTVFVTARNWWVPIVTKTRASLMPGEHTLTITYAVTGWSSLGCQVRIDAQPGKTYIVKGQRLPYESSEGLVAAKKPQLVKVVVWVVDEESGETVVNQTDCEPLT
jgi:hypothetical protein